MAAKEYYNLPILAGYRKPKMSHLFDGIATGATTRAARRATCTRNPKKLVLAVPVAPTSMLDEPRGEADEIVCHEDYEFFGAIGAYARDFSQVSDEEVIDIPKQFSRRLNETKTTRRIRQACPFGLS
jgi:predicted phosphoribosyltransferase